MFGYYNAITSLGLILMLVMLMILFSDEVLKENEKKGFILGFSLCIFELILDWFIEYFKFTNSDSIMLMKHGIALTYFLGVSINLVMVWTIVENKSKQLMKILWFMTALNMVLPLSIFFSDAIFYFDEANNFTLGNHFFVMVFQVVGSTAILFISLYRRVKKYHAKNNYILVLILCLFITGFILDYTDNGIKVLWVNEVLVFGFLYILYSTFVSQMDVLTGLLNRRSYENQVYDIKREAIILILDANKFKDINDNYGHSYGDFCLEVIGKTLRSVYASYGNCYRIGGDEFCVILTKNLDKIDELNNKFNKLLLEYPSEHGLPTMSTGYCRYIPDESSVQKTIEDADEMMYLMKSKSRTKS